MAQYLDELNAVTNQVYSLTVYENVWKATPSFIRVKSVEELVDGGASFSEDIALVANPNAVSYTGLGPLANGYVQEVVKANYDWAQYNCSITIPGIQVLANQGTEQIVNILAAKMQLAEKALEDLLGTDLLGTNTAIPGLIGLQVAIDDSTNYTTYATISRSTYPNWKGNLRANSGTTRAWTLDLANKAYQDARINNASPKLSPTTQGIWNKMYNTFQPQQRFEDPEIAKLGFPNLMLNTAMVYVDPKVPTTLSGATNEMQLFINLDTIKMKSFRAMNFKIIEFRDASNQDGVIGHIRLYTQVMCVMPRLNTKLMDVDSSL